MRVSTDIVKTPSFIESSDRLTFDGRNLLNSSSCCVCDFGNIGDSILRGNWGSMKS